MKWLLCKKKYTFLNDLFFWAAQKNFLLFVFGSFCFLIIWKIPFGQNIAQSLLVEKFLTSNPVFFCVLRLILSQRNQNLVLFLRYFIQDESLTSSFWCSARWLPLFNNFIFQMSYN